MKANKKDYKGIEGYSLVFTWGTSRGQDTYGYTTVSCKFNNEKMGYCSGGGYDMKGTVFAQFVDKMFHEELKRCSTKGHYGFSFYNKKTRKSQTQWSSNCYDTEFLDGGCGFNCIQKVFRDKLGYNIKFVHESSNKIIYTITLAEGRK